MNNYLQQLLNHHLEGCKVVDYHMLPTQFLSVTYEGWEDFTMIVDDNTFSFLMDMVQANIKMICDKYKETHAIEQPCLSYYPKDKILKISVGIMPLERYDMIMERRKSNET